MSCATSFLSLLHSGAEDASPLEKAADCLLTYPNSLWHGRKVVPIQKSDKWEVTYESTACNGSGDLLCCIKKPGREFEENLAYSTATNTYSTSYDQICGFVLLGAIPYFTFIELPALVCSAIGMPMKHVVLNHSEKALAYNKLMKTYLIHEELLAQYEVLSRHHMTPNRLESELTEIRQKIQDCEQKIATRLKAYENAID